MAAVADDDAVAVVDHRPYVAVARSSLRQGTADVEAGDGRGDGVQTVGVGADLGADLAEERYL